MNSNQQARIDRLERLVVDLLRKLEQAENKAGRAAQQVRSIRNAGG